MSEPKTPQADMGAAGAADATRAGRSGRMRELLGPRREERRGRGELRFIETAVLLLVGVVLLVATVNDVHRMVNNGTRLAADLKSWTVYTAVYSHNPFIEQDIKTFSTRDVVCADEEKGKPKGKPQVCLIFTGPVSGGRRLARGGFWLVARGTDVHEPVLDRPQYRYACFGSAIAEHLCGIPKPPRGLPNKPLVGGT
jgi:hypothetical protein